MVQLILSDSFLLMFLAEVEVYSDDNNGSSNDARELNSLGVKSSKRM